jgi:hypothetical protein
MRRWRLRGFTSRHADEEPALSEGWSRHPRLFARITAKAWMPTFAGMTMRGRLLRLDLLF